MSYDDGADYWMQEDFEDAIARGIIAFYESEIKKNRGAFPSDRVNSSDLARARSVGFYVPGKARIVLADGFDTRNDPMPTFGTVLFPHDEKNGPKFYEGYCKLITLRQLTSFPKGIFRRGPGLPYEAVWIFPTNEGKVEGERGFFSLDRDGKPHAAERVHQDGNQMWRRTEIRQFEHDPSKKAEYENAGLYITQLIADERHTWRIEAIEKQARIRIGCEREEVKSLLYARDLPLTASGRKRPVLHLVHSHRRRMKSGVDVKIDEFLRGTREVEMDGTKFKVHPPLRYDENRFERNLKATA